MKRVAPESYRAPLHVYVEDPLTREILSELWADTQVNLIVTRGKSGVKHMVGAAPAHFRGQVFGIVDRDLDDDNEAAWSTADCTVLRLTAHEFENLLLDFDVLSALAKRSSAAEIKDAARAHAIRMLGWMICKAVLREMQIELGADFPTEPALNDVVDVADAEPFIRRYDYWTKHPTAWSVWTSPGAVAARVSSWEQRLRADLSSDAWLSTFSGKEIFRHLRSKVAGLDDAPIRPPNPTPSERDADLGKRVARKMRELGRVPPVIVRLRRVLRQKAGLP